MEAIKNLSEIARTLIETDARLEEDICKMTIFFPLLEALGYDVHKVGDIILNPAYNADGTYKLDYGLRGDAEDSIKTMVKMIPFGANHEDELKLIRDCFIPSENIEYLLLTDCFNYYVYANVENELFEHIVTFDITKMTNSQIQMLPLLANSADNNKQDYAIDENDEMEDDVENEDIDASSKYEKASTKHEKKTDEKKNSKNKSKIKESSKNLVNFICGSLCLFIIITSFIFGLYYRGNYKNWHKMPVDHVPGDLEYYALSGNLVATTYNDKLNKIKVNLTETSLPENVVVTFKLQSNDQTHLIEKTTDAAGNIHQDLDIPAAWQNCYVTVSAEIMFNQSQSSVTLTKYGNHGEKIISVDGNKFSLGTKTVYYDHSGIYAYIQEQEAIAEAERLQAIKNYFSNYTIVKYSNGDMCFYPKGYNTNDWDSGNDNITSRNKAYAKIYYDSKTQTATFYYVVGTLMKSASWPAGEFILSDGVSTYKLSISRGIWQYHMNNFTSITGWCRYDQNGVGNLLTILQSVYSNANSTIEFKDLGEKIYISAEDKTAVTSMLDLYSKYFAQGAINLKPEWFS
jgi:hypothetical protein